MTVLDELLTIRNLQEYAICSVDSSRGLTMRAIVKFISTFEVLTLLKTAVVVQRMSRAVSLGGLYSICTRRLSVV